MDFAHLEKKWQLEWKARKAYEPDTARGKKKYYAVVAYPYPSGAMHVGHVRTYTVPDVIARFRRMQGYNVLFPMAWHVTGTPIIGALKRLKEREKKQLHVLKRVFRMTDRELRKLREPMDYANYFIENHYKPSMQGLGLSIDWRREFTTNDKHYNKFIEWQYRKLRQKGLVKKGKHPVRFCLKSRDPVTAHDILEGEDADISKFVLVKFKLDTQSPGKNKGKKAREKPVFLPAATLRPETVYGVTNIWVSHGSRLAVADMGKEKWIISEEAIEKLSNQGKKARAVKRIKAESLIGKSAENPVTRDRVLILPASFVDPGHATGIVMSVPAHAPYDLVALKELDRKMLTKYRIMEEEIESIRPVKVVDSAGPGTEEEISRNKILHQADRRLEEITKDIYKREFLHGRLNSRCGPYRGKKVSQVKEALVRDFRRKGAFDDMYEFSKRVVCRDGGKVIVAVKDSWFLDYGNPRWKRPARDMFRKLKIIPDYARAEYLSGIEWVEDWPCIRNFGLGTALPWDRSFIIEPLSDSTIYMAFYTISHMLRGYKPASLEDGLFDYIFLGKGDVRKLSASTKIPESGIGEMRRSFEYWYPLDWNLSAHELIKNHMTFFIFHHSMLFDRKRWPRGQASWGVGLLDGAKMSSSKGNVLLAKDAIKNFGADAVRLFLVSSAEPWQDFDWRSAEAENYMKKVEWFHSKVITLYGSGRDGSAEKLSNPDKWLLTKLQEVISETTEALENFQTRKAGMKCFFEMAEHVKWYERRGEVNKVVINQALEDWVKLLAPFMPHVCEELWNRMGNRPFIFQSAYPAYNEKLVDKKSVYLESMLKSTLDDIESVMKITGIKSPKKIILYVPDNWKYDLFYALQEQVEYLKDRGRILKALMQDERFRQHADHIMKMLPSIMKSPGRLDTVLTQEEEFTFLKECLDFLEKEFRCKVEIAKAEESDSDKSKKAEPGKPGIELL